MKSLKKLILVLASALSLSGAAVAAGGGVAWDKFPQERMTDLTALQNGAKLFVNYCLNCHGATFMRYNRLRDIGLTDAQIEQNLIFTDAKVGDLMTVNLDARQAKEWFGGQPPDLTLVARSRAGVGGPPGEDYLYTFLRTFYRDPTKATGWNNLAFPNAGMPHVLWQLQGERLPVFEKVMQHGQETEVWTGRWEVVKPGTMSPQEYDAAIADLVAFMKWMSEPVQNDRRRLGVFVLLFLAVFTVIAWRLNAAFWKDVK